MSDAIKSFLLRVLRVPAEPAPPAGAPESIRVFRAAANFYKLCLIQWGIVQALLLLGLVVLLVLGWTVIPAREAWPVRIMSVLGVVMLCVELPCTYLFVRFDYEMRWYIVTDRSLRIRHGLQQVREMTMTFANIQQITVRQGPLQRWLGLADVEVRTAGGGGAQPGAHGGGGGSMHTGYFHGVNNAEEIRDLMLERLRRWRETGLGDPDENVSTGLAAGASVAIPGHDDAVEAARQVLAEARALRAAVAST